MKSGLDAKPLFLQVDMLMLPKYHILNDNVLQRFFEILIIFLTTVAIR